MNPRDIPENPGTVAIDALELAGIRLELADAKRSSDFLRDSDVNEAERCYDEAKAEFARILQQRTGMNVERIEKLVSL